MSQESVELKKVLIRLENLEANRKYDSDRHDELKAQYGLLGKQIDDLKQKIKHLEEEVFALRECLSLKEAGMSHLSLLGQEEPDE